MIPEDMRFVGRESIYYRIINGKNYGKMCAILEYNNASTGLEGIKVVRGEAHVVLMQDIRTKKEEIVWEKIENLIPREIPGWDDRIPDNPVCLEKYLEDKVPGIRNCLRTETVAQPRVIVQGDFLATSKRVMAGQRWGCNSTILLKLSEFGWVELAGRLPIAMFGTQKTGFRMPIDLCKGDVLATNCEVLEDPKARGREWVDVLLTGGFKGALIDIPSCVPIALKSAL